MLHTHDLSASTSAFDIANILTTRHGHPSRKSYVWHSSTCSSALASISDHGCHVGSLVTVSSPPRASDFTIHAEKIVAIPL